MPASASPDTTQSDQEAQDDLQKLAAALTPTGCKTVLVTGENRQPHLYVINPDAPTLTERVYAQADNYWWPWTQAIASRDHPAAAADTIARTLHLPGPRTANGQPGPGAA